MGDQPNLESESSKDRAWTTDEIRKHSANWTLAGDVGLYNLLNDFSHYIISRTHEVENAVDSLVHQTKMTTAKINNVINDFHMLSNMQFVENRVYDEEVHEPVKENKPIVEKTKEQREAEMLPKIVQAIELGLAVLDTAFDRINVNEISDSEDEEDISSEGHTILEPKDPYEHRPLPYIIGSAEFMKCDYAGLKDLIEEDVPSFSEESSISETDETSSDEGEPLPHDDDRFSEKPNVIVAHIADDRVSSSDESELFGSEKEVNGFGSESSLEVQSKEKQIQRVPVDAQPVKEARQNSVSSLQSKLKLPQVLPVPKLQEKNKNEDLFTSDDHSDDESPFRKKTGLFTSDIRFNDEKDDLFGDDLFGKSPEKVKEVKPVNTPKVAPQKPQSIVPEARKPTLFDNDEDSEEDIFNTLMKTKKPSITKTSNTGSQDSSEKADTSSTPSSAPSTKPSGNAFDFITGSGNTDSLFGDDSDGDDLFSSKKTQGKKFEFDSSENDDLFGSVGSKAPKESKPPKKNLAESEQSATKKTKSPMFEDSGSSDQPSKKNIGEPVKAITKKTKSSIFEDSDSSDQEKLIPVKSSLSVPSQSKKGLSLFDDDDDLDEDIFNKVSKESKISKVDEKPKQSLFDDSMQVNKISKTSKLDEKPKPASIFDDSTQPTPKESKLEKPVEKTKALSLFDNTEEPTPKESKLEKPVEKTKALSLFDNTVEEPTSISPSVPKSQQNKLSSLFDDSDNFDLFAPKPPVKQNETKTAEPFIIVPKPEVPKVKVEVEETAAPKVSSPAKDASADSQASFDIPVDSSNVLNAINKSRAKVTTKRRKPTRQGRLAALENSEKEVNTHSEVPVPESTKPESNNLDEDSDSLFSSAKPSVKSEPPRLDHKSQEKKKMNLMSQLISEVATSKVALKRTAGKEEEDEEEVDIFSEATKKDRSKSSFSFRPPEENGIASVFPIEKNEDKKDDDISKSDSFEDDFFTEPAFQNFRSSISHKDPVLDLGFVSFNPYESDAEKSLCNKSGYDKIDSNSALSLFLDDDDDDEDDLFSAIKTNALPKAKTETPDQNSLFSDDTDIFADVQKEKYEMFPNQVYDDDDDDIFSNVNSNSNKLSSKPSNYASVKKVETQQVNAFDDPLTGLLGE